jgi:fructose-1-phosphate kinase PfkB-like protein
VSGRCDLAAVTVSLAIDRVALVGELFLGGLLRPETVSVLPGGKAVNAVRAARAVGAAVAVAGPAGGHGGRWLDEALRDEDLGPALVAGDVEPRTTYVVVDHAGRHLSVYERAPVPSPELVRQLQEVVGRPPFSTAAALLIAGSVPDAPHLETFIADVVAGARRRGQRCAVDLAGAALRAALRGRPALVKINRDEAGELLAPGRAPPATADAVAGLLAAGADAAIVTDGAAEVVGAAADSWWRARPARVDVRATVGAGDTFSGVLLADLARGEPFDDALRHATAAAAASTRSLGGGVLDAGDVAALIPDVTVERLRRP